ncbi:co-regulatory protein PtrA N-terminal domain-containing protein [Pseudomonas rustica]|jgi:hypothetical protein|uniref:co-regulatory protein PtrA N-terminal domain-containing protein n=1 Tax=Pseudomonas TaxID=286 RepID=UPI00135C3AB0|nr:co-regulatory protein PtrA N-terminal domain-containing protein [Pseudomonas sp. 18058]
MNHFKSVLLAGAMLLSSTVYAEGGGDRTFAHIEELMRMQQASAMMLTDIEKMPKKDQAPMVGEHMKMLGDVMDQLSKATPDTAMSDKDKMVWMQKHQAIVADVLSQMRREHAMMFSLSHNLN